MHLPPFALGPLAPGLASGWSNSVAIGPKMEAQDYQRFCETTEERLCPLMRRGVRFRTGVGDFCWPIGTGLQVDTHRDEAAWCVHLAMVFGAYGLGADGLVCHRPSGAPVGSMMMLNQPMWGHSWVSRMIFAPRLAAFLVAALMSSTRT